LDDRRLRDLDRGARALESLRRSFFALGNPENVTGEIRCYGRACDAQSPQNFVVHGHDEAALQAAARFVERLGLEAIILREQPDQGRTIIEKFEDCAAEVGFAIVLLTPDDLAGPAGAPAAGAQARQNVIFELGYFAGKLGRGRTCVLRKGQVDIPSDLYGVIYTEMDASEGWKRKLAKELRAAGLDFDPAKVLD
jgi:predicted nucleotide-binding protein